MIRVCPGIALDEEEIREDFIRSSGPGGQNVNKVSTAVKLRFDAAGSRSLGEDVRRRLIALAGARATREGEIVLDGRRFRSREQNRRDVLERLLELIRRAARPPKVRRKTAPTRASRERRLQAKRRRSQRKRLRGGWE